MRPLAGITIVELGGIGPGPFCGMLLADLGASVIVVERARGDAGGPPQLDPAHAIFNRGKRSIVLDLKTAADRDTLLGIVRRADGLIEGMRPGAVERLGVGPDQCRAINPRLVYGRITGWGQSGPMAHAAGHDLNYLAQSGALWYAGQAGQAPLPPPTMLGDVGGGALYLAVGMLAALLRAKASGVGAVVDASILDGSAHMMTLLLSRRAAGHMPTERGRGLFDGPHWSRVYRCADDRWISVQALEPKFYALLLQKLGLDGDPEFARQYDAECWPALGERLGAVFRQRTAAQWCDLLEGTDACFAPVLSPEEAARHPHNQARGLYVEHEGVLQAAASPRFVGEPAWQPAAIPQRGQHTEAVMREFFSEQRESGSAR